MPTPARTSLDEIVEAGRSLIESAGLEGLTMQSVAERVGVKAPSLYKRVESRAHLIKLVAEDVIADLTTTLEASVRGEDAWEDAVALARAFRRFAHRNPGAYGLIFSTLPEEIRPGAEHLAAASQSVLRTASSLSGPENALEAARTLTAWAHGFVTLELSGGFHLGGDVDKAFDFGVSRLAKALSR